MDLNATRAIHAPQTRSGMIHNAIHAIPVHPINCAVAASVIRAALVLLTKCAQVDNATRAVPVHLIRFAVGTPAVGLLALSQARVPRA